MKYISYFTIGAILLISMVSCSKEEGLSKSIYIADSTYSELPSYSEWGYNTFGCYLDRQVVVSNDYLIPAKVIVKDGKLGFNLNGQLGHYYSSGDPEFSIKFSLPVTLPQNYKDLVALNNQTIDLKSAGCKVVIINNSKVDTLIINSGTLQFKKVQMLKVDDVDTEVIMSGYFNFLFLLDDEPFSISEGRFDVGIGPDNFYNL